MGKYKAIIFDMDGTIINTEHIWKTVTHDLIKSKDENITQELFEEINEQLRGLAIHRSCALIKDKMNLVHTLHELMEEKRERAGKMYQEGIEFIPGFKEFHQQVIAANLQTAIATNADAFTLACTKEVVPLAEFFGEHVYNICHVNNKAKPDPDVYLHAAQQLGVNPTECIAIEDSTHGISAAKAAGMFCIGINTAGNRHALRHADMIIEAYDEINLTQLLN